MAPLSGATAKRPRRVRGGMRLPALLLAALASAGCLADAPGSDGSGFGGRSAADVPEGSAFDHAECAMLGSWRQPGLHDAVARWEPPAGAERSEASGEAGLPVDLAPVGLAGARVTYFARDSGRDSVFLYPNETSGAVVLAGMLAPERTRGEARALFDAFAPRVLEADEATLDAWFDAWWASRQPGLLSVGPDGVERVEQHSLDVEVDAPLLVAQAWADLPEPAEERRHGPSAHLRWETQEGAWVARLSWPELRVRAQTPEAPFVLRVTADDVARAFSSDLHWETEEETRDWVRRAMVDLGLPGPSFEEWRRDGGIC